ncbi:MAG: hypothetical protein JWO29_1979, partial [Arthrobacter sp.]|nr:hypothetical protein [Arthrobacter sp.]
HAGGDQGIELKLGVLAGSTHACITQLSHSPQSDSESPRNAPDETINGETS